MLVEDVLEAALAGQVRAVVVEGGEDADQADDEHQAGGNEHQAGDSQAPVYCLAEFGHLTSDPSG